jgi:hypothetical protein
VNTDIYIGVMERGVLFYTSIKNTSNETYNRAENMEAFAKYLATLPKDKTRELGDHSHVEMVKKSTN